MINSSETKTRIILDDLFKCREEKLYALTDDNKKEIEDLTKNNDSYEKLFRIIGELSSDTKILEKVRDSLDSYIDKINIIAAYDNERFYKIRICRCNKSNIGVYK